MQSPPTLSFPPLEPVPLPRGGVAIATSDGLVQFGAPPETIKDTLTSDLGVAHIFVLTRRLFDTKRGIRLAEIEFPAFYNFFKIFGT